MGGVTYMRWAKIFRVLLGAMTLLTRVELAGVPGLFGPRTALTPSGPPWGVQATKHSARKATTRDG